MKEYKLENKVGDFIKDMVDQDYRVIKSLDNNNILRILTGDIVCGEVVFGEGEDIFLRLSYSPENQCKQCEEFYKVAEKYSGELFLDSNSGCKSVKDISDKLLKGRYTNTIVPRGLPHIVAYSSDFIEMKTKDRVWSIRKSERKSVEEKLVIPLLKKLQSKDDVYQDVNAYSMKSFCSRTKDKGSIKSSTNDFLIALQFFYIYG